MLMCYYHPHLYACGGCVNCHKLICDSCKVQWKGRILCAPCYTKLCREKKIQGGEERVSQDIKDLLKRMVNNI